MAAEAVRLLVRLATEAAPLRPHELDLVVQRSGGNPLFSLEIVRAAREIGSFEAVPQSLEAAMAAQVDALDPPARRLLRYASVLGRSFSRQVLFEVLGAEGYPLDDATLARLQDFLEEDGPERLRFRSGIVCDTTYESVSYQLRRRLHRNVAETLEQLAADPAGEAGVLALHYARADDPARTWHYARIAADQARDLYANAEAARLYALALDAARQTPDVPPAEEIPVLTELGRVRERAGLLEDAVDAFSRAIRLAGGDALTQARLLASRANAKDRTRNFAGAIRDLRTGLRRLEQSYDPGTEAERALLEKDLAWMFFGQDRPAKALAQARRAADRARTAAQMEALGGALIILELAGLMVEGPGPGHHLQEAREIFERLGNLSMLSTVHANLGVVCAIAGRWKEAVDCFETARELCTRIGDVTRGADPALNLGEMLVKQRRFDEAEPVLRDSIEVLRAAHFYEGMNRGEIQLARILIERGAFADADAMLIRVEQQFRDGRQPLAALEAATVRALGVLRSGSAEAALNLLDEANAATGADAALLLPVVACVRGAILSLLGRHDEAWQVLSAGLETAQIQGMPYEQAMLVEEQVKVAARGDFLVAPEDAETAHRIMSDLDIRPEST
jgi:tetratricopeptide (TPR) repeat protein